MPHSLLFYQERLWLANSGKGEFGYLLPVVRMLMMLGFRSDAIQRLITFPRGEAVVRHNLQQAGGEQPPASAMPWR